MLKSGCFMIHTPINARKMKSQRPPQNPRVFRTLYLSDFMAAYNFRRSLKTLNGLTPYEYVCKIWTSEPERFIINPNHQNTD